MIIPGDFLMPGVPSHTEKSFCIGPGVELGGVRGKQDTGGAGTWKGPQAYE